MTTTESDPRVTPPRVLVVGDANLDLVLRGDVIPRFGQAEQLLDSADLVLGSSAGIMACGLARLGVETALAARVGDDFFGERTRQLLAAVGVDTSRVLRSDDPTGLSVILSSPHDRSILTLLGAMSTLTDDDVRDAAAAFRPRHVHVASFFLVPRVAAALPDRLAALRAAGVTTSLDTNWDPAERWEGVQACLPHVDVLLPNATEVIELARAVGGHPSSAEDAASQLAALGPCVVLKDGAKGDFAVSGAVVERPPGLTVDVVDTTGAGDSFDAGFLAAWLEGRGLAESLRWAAAAGSLSTRGAGGTGGQATRDELISAIAGAEPTA
jgi:sugar/nucleoside kinase (ribokinase family)